MSLTNTMKIIGLSVYTIIVAFTPSMPNIYTFVVNSMEYTFSIAASAFLIYFLKTRPMPQQNFLNRILILITATILVQSARAEFMSLIACFWNSELKEFLKVNPLMVHFLSYRSLTLLLLGLASWLSAGRLMLFTNPVVFHKLRPTRTAAVSLFLTVVVITIDFIYGLVVCYDNPKTMLAVAFRVETGIEESFEINSTTVKQNSTGEQEEDTVQPCYHLPTVPILILSALLMEISRVIYVIITNFKKKKNSRKVNPVKKIKTRVSNKRDFALKRSKSQVKIASQNSVKSRRSHSLPVIPRISNLSIPSTQVGDSHDVTEKNIETNFVIDILKQQCMKTASVLTVCLVVGLVASILLYQFFSVSTVFKSKISLLMSNLVVVLLVSFDKDIILCFQEKVINALFNQG